MWGLVPSSSTSSSSSPSAGPGDRESQREPEAEAGPEREGVDYTRVARGPFSDVLPERALVRGRYSVRDQLVDLRRIPQRPRKVFNLRHLLVLGKRLFDIYSNRPTRFGRMVTRMNPYPHPFRRVTIRSFDGTQISGWLGLQPSRRPGVVLVPGLFSSKDDSAQKRKALKLWRRWNYNVLAIDMRGFGQSEQVPSTPGWKEAEDVLAAARFLYAFNPVSQVGVAAESMGATAALLAAAQEGIWEEEAEKQVAVQATPTSQRDQAAKGGAGAQAFGLRDPEPVKRVATQGGADSERGHAKEGEALEAASKVHAGEMGGLRGRPPGPARVIRAVFAVSPFAEAKPAVAHLDRVPPRASRFRHQVHRIFRRLLQDSSGGRHTSFLAYMEDSARHYGVSTEELYARSDLTRVIAHIRAPSLILHAQDDDLVPLVHADRLGRLVADRDDVAVWILRWGRHVEFDTLDRRWYWRVKSRFMGQWVGR